MYNPLQLQLRRDSKERMRTYHRMHVLHTSTYYATHFTSKMVLKTGIVYQHSIHMYSVHACVYIYMYVCVYAMCCLCIYYLALCVCVSVSKYVKIHIHAGLGFDQVAKRAVVDDF